MICPICKQILTKSITTSNLDIKYYRYACHEHLIFYLDDSNELMGYILIHEGVIINSSKINFENYTLVSSYPNDTHLLNTVWIPVSLQDLLSNPNKIINKLLNLIPFL